MIQILQDFQALGDDVVRFSAFDIHHEADATGVVLVAGVVQALSHNLIHFLPSRIPMVGGGATAGRSHCLSAGELAIILPRCSESGV
jgi:hypothetical protein